MQGGEQMKYENGQDVLPESLLKEVQKYASGKMLYIPTVEKKRRWGESSGYKQILIERNRQIRSRFNSGASIDALADEFGLSFDSIKKIVYIKRDDSELDNAKQATYNTIVNRIIYISNEQFSLGEYITDLDSAKHYECWLDEETQYGYNYKVDFTYEEFITAPERLRMEAVVIRNSDSAVVGVVTLSPEDYLPDLAIMLYPEYRGLGYSTPVYKLALNYCFDAFDLNEIYAGCYEDNPKSLKMLINCGFESHSEADGHEIHYITGLPRVQKDFKKYRYEHNKND